MASNFPLASRIKLANGQTMPHIHLGLYLMSGPETTQAVHHALDAGYRGFDSAQMYHNESQTGRAILSWLASPSNTPTTTPERRTLTRKDIHYTTKLASNSTSASTVRRSIRESVDACGLGYVDLFLLHSPYGGPEARSVSWRAVCDAVGDGEVRMGGVSNFGVKHIGELVASNSGSSSDPTPPLPLINQIEVHPFNTRTPIRDLCTTHNITIQAYAPLARALRMQHPLIKELSGKYGCTAGQLMVRWSLQRGCVPLPKSVRKERIRENGEVGGFNVEEGDLEKMDGLDEGLCTDWDPVDCA